MLQQLASFPGLKTGRGYSAVVLDRFQARPALRCFSIPGGWERDYISLARLPQQLLEQHTLLSLISWAYTQPVLYLVCCFNSVPGAVLRSILRFSLRLVRCLRGSLREHDCAISTIDPRNFTFTTSISTTPGLKFTSGTWLRNTSVFSNFSQRDYSYSTNTKFTVRRTDTYTHTYIHTDTARVQHVNVGLAQARPNKCARARLITYEYSIR